jgi:hypothetical protein
MHEQRQAPRTRVLKAAKLLFDEPCSIVDCTVRNVSITGACLEFSTPVSLPDIFELSFDSFRSARRCQLRWRSDNKMGVSFS